MSMTIYGIKSCDTCRKATKALPEANFRDIRSDPLSDAERAEFLKAFGEVLLNRASTTWRGLTDDERAETAETLLEKHPTLMKRPVIRTGESLFLGWKADTKQAFGLT